MSPKLKSFLKNLAKFGPVVLLLNPATAKHAPLIIDLIGKAEKLPGASGVEKKAFVMDAIAPLVDIATEKGTKGFEDPALTLATISAGIDTTVGVVRIVSGAKKIVALEDVPAPPEA